jgi:uncharacterized membrane protein YhhN
MKKSQVYLHLAILPFVGLELYSRWLAPVNLEYIAKPILLVWIAVYFLLYSSNRKTRLPVILAFFFSWLGDMFLMLAHNNEILFYAGVGGFFLAQLFYFYTFLFVSGDKKIAGYLRCSPAWLILFVIYLVVVLRILYAGMEGIMIPVITVYAISLLAMSAAALNRRYRVDNNSFTLVFVGSLFFVISDSMIAINKFAFSFERASFFIILSYLAAQYMIMRGLLREWEDEGQRGKS